MEKKIFTYTDDETGKMFSYHAKDMNEAMSLIKGWLHYHSLPMQLGYKIIEGQNEKSRIEDGWVNL